MCNSVNNQHNRGPERFTRELPVPYEKAVEYAQEELDRMMEMERFSNLLPVGAVVLDVQRQGNTTQVLIACFGPEDIDPPLVGSAKKMHKDEFDMTIGIQVALSNLLNGLRYL